MAVKPQFSHKASVTNSCELCCSLQLPSFLGSMLVLLTIRNRHAATSWFLNLSLWGNITSSSFPSLGLALTTYHTPGCDVLQLERWTASLTQTFCKLKSHAKLIISYRWTQQKWLPSTLGSLGLVGSWALSTEQCHNWSHGEQKWLNPGTASREEMKSLPLIQRLLLPPKE